MPSQKRPRETTATPPPSIEGDAPGGWPQSSENHERRGPEYASGSDGSSYSSGGEDDEFIVVDLGEIRNEVQCPICLGIIRKTRTVMECLHRFCRECIDKAMRLGNKECPACRTHCGSRRSLRDDPNYDALIAALYPDIEKYDEEDLSFHEEEKARNKQIQDSIAKTSHRQAEALGKKLASSLAYHKGKGKYQNVNTRRNHGLDAEEGDNSKYSSSTDNHDHDHSVEVRSKRYKKQPSSGAKGGYESYDDNDSQGKKEVLLIGKSLDVSVGWGRSCLRSSFHNGGIGRGNKWPSRNDQLTKFVNYLQCSDEKSLVPTKFSVDDPKESATFVPSNHELQLLNENQTLEEISTQYNEANLVLDNRHKGQGSLKEIDEPRAENMMKCPVITRSYLSAVPVDLKNPEK